MRTALRPLVALAALVLLPCPAPAANPEPIVVFVDGQRREVLPVLKGGAELIPVDVVIAGTGVRARADAARGTLTLTHQGRELVFYAGQDGFHVAIAGQDGAAGGGGDRRDDAVDRRYRERLQLGRGGAAGGPSGPSVPDKERPLVEVHVHRCCTTSGPNTAA